jgi:hypothetical protein
MTDGTEYQSSTPTKRRVPPPLPARGLRPTIARNDSSTSHYSDAQDGGLEHATPPSSSIAPAQVYTGTTSQVPVDGPPGYELEQHQAAYPTEKGAFTDEPRGIEHAPQTATVPEGLTEGERLEWEQHYADQQLAEQANKLVLNHGDKEESLR